MEIISEINSKKHTKFKVSRFERLKNLEKESLKPLPLEPYQYIEWKEAKVHPDSHISIKSCYYSVPHIYRGQRVKVKISRHQIEVYINLERIAVHKRNRDKACVYITDVKHLPDNSKAYYEATPKNILAQAKYISHDLYEVLDGLFQENTLSNLRRAQGFIREAKNEINFSGNNQGNENIKKACDMMVRFNKIRTPYFKQLLKHFRKEKIILEDRNIQRKPGNPMLRILDINKLKEEEKKHVTCTD
jgi:hypothetical protein